MRKNLFYAIAVVCALLLVAPTVMAEQKQITKLKSDRIAEPTQDGIGAPLPASVDTSTTLTGQTFITKSPLAFETCYTNVSGVVLGDDETVEGQLRALLFANGKSAGDFSILLEAIPTLAVGATWCDTFAAVVPPTTKSKKVQKILRTPVRVQVRVKINSVVDAGSESYAAFRIEEKDVSDNYWLIGNDEGHDINGGDGFGGTNGGLEIGPADGVFGNEGFWTVNNPNTNGDAVAVYGVSPSNGGASLFVTQFDFSAADFFGGPATPATVGLFGNTAVFQSNRPDLTNVLVSPVPVTPPAANSTSGGDHGNTITFSPVAITAGDPVWAIYFMGAGRSDFFGIDNPNGLDGGAGVVDFDSTFGSNNGFGTATGAFAFPTADGGNWVAAFGVNDPAGSPFPSGGDNSVAFSAWKDAALSQMGE
jgi:hypothetical protein